jgi:orotidine-5'-phosphate decarboxylase
LIEACGEHCVAVKPQLACYERLGAAGWEALAATMADAGAAGLLTVADGKRGDVPHTASVYAEAMIALGADAFTANPLPGGDSLDALIEVADSAGAGVFVLTRMSNPGAADFFDASVGDGTLADAIAAAVAARAPSLRGETGLSGLGAVVGATAPEHLERLREAMPDSVILVPGVGAQGGRPDDLGPAVGAGPASVLFPVSRGIAAAGDPADAAARLRAELWAVSA